MKALLAIFAALANLIHPSMDVDQLMVKDPSLGSDKSAVYVRTVDSVTHEQVECDIVSMLFGIEPIFNTEKTGYKEITYSHKDGSYTVDICTLPDDPEKRSVTFDLKPGYATYLTIPVDGVKAAFGSSGSSFSS